MEDLMLKNIALIASLFLVIGCSTKGDLDETKPLKEGQLPLEMFFRNPVARNVVMSPDGTKLASLQPYKDRMNVYIRNVADTGKEWQLITNVTDRDIASMFWKGNDTILFTKDFGGDENFHLFSVNVTKKDWKDLTNYKETRVMVVSQLDDVSETDVLIGMNKRDAKIFDIYRLNVVTGATEMILQNPGNYTSYLVDHKGEVRVAVATDGVNNTYFYRDAGKKDFKKVITLNFKDSLDYAVFDKNNKNVYGTTNIGRNTEAAVEINPATGKVVKTLYTNTNNDVLGVSYSKARKELINASYADWKMRQKFFSKFYEGVQNAVDKEIKDREVFISNSNKAEDAFVIVAMGDRGGAEYYTYDSKTKKLEFLLDSTPWLKDDQLVEMRPIQYKSRDGLTIHGYLFLPKGMDMKTAKNLPVVVNPHGGPWARDMWGYTAESQFLANRGYAVLKMNFRGSTGYGKKFWKASFKQWGLKMQDDVTDGVNWLVKEGIADKNRVAIYGGSYGGYATLAGLAFTPDLYRCGVDYVGVSNIFTLMETIPPYWKPMQEMFYEMVGHPEKEKELVKKASPLFSADKIKAPLFVAQGAKDPRVKKSESDQIVDALKKRGVDVPYLVKDNEGHGFRNEENRFEFYKKMEVFLDKHMTPATAAAM